MGTIYIYKTRLASNEIFSPSNKIHWEVGWAKYLSAPRYIPSYKENEGGLQISSSLRSLAVIHWQRA
jgi:hypothetical protein